MSGRLTASTAELEERIRAAERVVSAEAGRDRRDARLSRARALVDQGDAYREMRDDVQAAACYERAVGSLDGEDASDPDVSDLTGLALALRAVALSRAGRAEDALAASAQALDVVGDGQTAMLRRAKALALTARAAGLARSGRLADCQEVAEQIIKEFASDPVHGPKQTNVVAGARFTGSLMLLKEGDSEGAESGFADLIDTYGEDDTPSVMLLVAKARAQQGRALARLGRTDEAGRVWATLVDEYLGCEDQQFREIGVVAGVEQVSAQIEQARYPAALALAQQLSERLTVQPLPHSPQLTRTVLLFLARAQRLMEQTDAALGTVQTLLDQSDLLAADQPGIARVASGVTEMVEQLARAGDYGRALAFTDGALERLRARASDLDPLAPLWLHRPRLMRESGASLGAVVAGCDEVLAMFADRPDGVARDAFVNALRQKAVAIAKDGETRGAIGLCDRIIDGYRDQDDAQIREAVAAAMALKANTLLKRRRRRAALRALDELAVYCGDDPPAPLRRWADEARTRSVGIRARRADQRRLRLIAIALLAWSTAPMIHAAWRELRRRRTRRR